MSKREQVLCDSCGSEIEKPVQMVLKKKEVVKVDVRIRRTENGTTSEIDLDVCANCLRFNLEPENS